MKHITIELTEKQAEKIIGSLEFIRDHADKGNEMLAFYSAESSAKLLNWLKPKIEKAKEA